MTKAVLRPSTRVAQTKVHKERVKRSGNIDTLAKSADVK